MSCSGETRLGDQTWAREGRRRDYWNSFGKPSFPSVFCAILFDEDFMTILIKRESHWTQHSDGTVKRSSLCQGGLLCFALISPLLRPRSWLLSNFHSLIRKDAEIISNWAVFGLLVAEGREREIPRNEQQSTLPVSKPSSNIPPLSFPFFQRQRPSSSCHISDVQMDKWFQNTPWSQ